MILITLKLNTLPWMSQVSQVYVWFRIVPFYNELFGEWSAEHPHIHGIYASPMFGFAELNRIQTSVFLSSELKFKWCNLHLYLLMANLVYPSPVSVATSRPALWVYLKEQ